MERWILKGGRYREYIRLFSVNPLIAKILASRLKPEDVKDFLDKDSSLSDPFLLPDMEKGIMLLRQHLERKSRIRIVGDYDVDGITATAILYLGLKELGARVDCRIPERIGEGYGFGENIAQEISRDGVSLVITCDNGIRESATALYLKERKIDLIITDHHEVEKDGNGEDRLPEAEAVINPHRSDSHYPYPEICGAAVAYQFIRGVRQKSGSKTAADRLLGYAALGTICDVMPLTGENRRIVHKGLAYLNEHPGQGLGALMRISNTKQLTPYTAGYVIGPMLNAGGRLGSQNRYLPILIAEEEAECEKLAKELLALNQERQKMTEDGIREGISQLERKDSCRPVKVLYLPDLHESIAGLVAGKLKEKIHCPVFVVTKGKEGLKGSGRSIPGYSMFEEMCKVSELFAKYGGHPMAAGFSLISECGKEEEAVERMEQRLNQVSALTPKDCISIIYIDAAVRMQDLTLTTVRSLTWLEPYGTGNPKPVLAQKGLTVKRGRWLGQGRKALRVTLASDGVALEALLFRTDLLTEQLSEENKACLESGEYFRDPFSVDICYQAEVDTYGTEPKVKFIIQNMRRAEIVSVR